MGSWLDTPSIDRLDIWLVDYGHHIKELESKQLGKDGESKLTWNMNLSMKSETWSHVPVFPSPQLSSPEMGFSDIIGDRSSLLLFPLSPISQTTHNTSSWSKNHASWVKE